MSVMIQEEPKGVRREVK